MSWARLDDGFHSHPKVLEVWERCPAAVGLYARALSYVANHEIDGKVPDQALAVMAPDEQLREEATSALVDVGLWDKNGSGYFIHDFLDYNRSRQEQTERRRADRERKAEARR